MRNKKTIGDVMLEFLFAFPIVVLCSLAVIQLALICMASLVVQYAAYSAARAGLVHQGDEELWAKTSATTGKAEFAFEGLTHVYGQYAHNEAQLAACEAAAQVCALLTMMTPDAAPGTSDLSIPGWGDWRSSSAARRKTRAWLSNHRPEEGTFDWPVRSRDIASHLQGIDEWSRWPSSKNDWNVYSIVEHDYELIVPVIGQLIAWGEHLAHRGRSAGNATSFSDKLEATRRGYTRNGMPVPYLSLVETCVLPKPYRTIVPTRTYGAVPQSIDWFTDVGYLFWIGNNPDRASGVLLMDDASGVANQDYHHIESWGETLSFQDQRGRLYDPLDAETMTVSLDVAGIHSFGDRLLIGGVEIFKFDPALNKRVRDIDNMHNFEITLGQDAIRQIFSDPTGSYDVTVEAQNWDDIVWRDLHVGFNEEGKRPEDGLIFTQGAR